MGQKTEYMMYEQVHICMRCIMLFDHNFKMTNVYEMSSIGKVVNFWILPDQRLTGKTIGKIFLPVKDGKM